MSSNEPADFGEAPDSRWSVRGSIDDLPALLGRASAFLDIVAASRAVRDISLQRYDSSGEAEVVVSFNHWLLPADLDYLVALHPGRGDDQVDDIGFVLDLAERLEARSAIDFGCGWGALAVALAERGLEVTGIDPARAMLEQARARDSAEVVRWVQGDAQALEEAGPVDLVVMTGNIPSIYVSDQAWDELLRAIRGALRPGGHVAFGSWNPRTRPWESWGGEARAVPAGQGGFRVGGEIGGGIELAGGKERLHAPSVWRYRTAEELVRSLTHAGFEIEEAYGDWQESPLLSASPEIVLVAQRTSGDAQGPEVQRQ
jgi:2-polyprenyl-3-methyl-5-hydroxy-6-metoxy-1,4-benzoquinol methylase